MVYYTTLDHEVNAGRCFLSDGRDTRSDCRPRSLTWTTSRFAVLTAHPARGSSIQCVARGTETTAFTGYGIVSAGNLGFCEAQMNVSRSRFDAIMKTYDQLAELTLSTIRIDVRCRVMHYLDSGIQSVSCVTGSP